MMNGEDWTVADLPGVNACLNGLATVLLVFGYILIKKKAIDWHRRVMVAAFFVSVVFLICYLYYHFNTALVSRYHGPASLRTVYYTILISHVILAVLVPPLCLVTLYRAWKGQFERHRRIAKVTFPIWLYVSITGVVVYLMLYRL